MSSHSSQLSIERGASFWLGTCACDFAGSATKQPSSATAIHAALWISCDCAAKWLRVNLFHVLGLLGLAGIVTRLALLREDSLLCAVERRNKLWLGRISSKTEVFDKAINDKLLCDLPK